MQNSIALLTQIGTALYGHAWQTQVANDLGVTDRTVRRWVAGTSAIPTDVWGRLQVVMDAHAEILTSLSAKIC